MDPEAAYIANLLVAHAAIALGHAREEHHLREALATRKTVGMIMQQHEIDEDPAFHFLLGRLQHQERQVRDRCPGARRRGNRKFVRPPQP